MKKVLVVALTAMLVCAMTLPLSALELYSNEISNVFDDLPSQYANAVVIPFGDHWTDGATNARHGNVSGQINDFDYVYLKADDLGDFSVTFNAEKDGLYEFGFTLMGWTKSVLRTTNVKIDDSELVYIAYDYTEENQYHNHYWYGISAILSAGEHTITLSLADDFDDTNVKSLYFANFFYIHTDLPAEPEETAPEVVEPVVEADTPAPTQAPQTFDIALTGLAAAVTALSGIVIFKKKK
ncbi:MAG: hypothetical protein PHZ09_05995 [Eubacteriales bacterium]|nr:hypothetical protein [Eubacteriales bacterium]